MTDHADTQRLPVRVCAACGRVHQGQPSRCEQCGSDALEARELPGRGCLVTWTVVRRPPDAFAAEGPMTVGLVDIDDGPRLTARFSALDGEPPLGSRVRIDGFAGEVPLCVLAR